MFIRPNENFWQSIAGGNGFIAIVMGAVAAHAVTDAHAAAMADKASLYQLIHAVILLWLAERHGKFFACARWIFLSGILLFCGTLYLKALAGWVAVTQLAPLGGLCFMAGWLLIASQFMAARKNS